MKITISENIKRLRKEKNITQAELAANFGVTCQSVCRWENGAAYPDIELIPEIAAYFGVSTDTLLGCDNESVEGKIRKVFQLDIIGEMDVKEKISIMRGVMADLPYEPQIKYHILRQYHILGTEEATKNIKELREFAEFICASDAQFWIKHNTRVTMVEIEPDEEKLQSWLDQLGNDYVTPDDALLNRYKYQGQTDAFNRKAQENIIGKLTKALIYGFKATDDPEYNKAANLAVLDMIDVLRDTLNDNDAWMRHRALIMFRLASAYLTLNETEKAYEALESGVELLVKIIKLPENAVVKYNSPLFDLMEKDKVWLAEPVEDMVSTILTGPYGPWPALRGISDSERYKSIIERITNLL